MPGTDRLNGTEKRMQGWQDSDLTELRQYNARALGERLRDNEFNQVYISPSKRTEETAKPYWDRAGSSW
ncbi:histidine phosphatase family protein [Bacillus vallismortis]|nr:histidine phosphatase family protein [Bacillus vallismortis]MCY8533680.1 histidine phosphatase family protein [Bacillus vallismortis]MCY8545858.1 histidine phosphatase family protein [Bacillus vallismortis]